MTLLKQIYGTAEFKANGAQQNISSITFAGIVVGMLFFGYTSDKFSRKWSLMTSTAFIVVFAILCTGAYGDGTPHSLFTAIAVYRFFLGIGIGGEYPSGSVGAAEGSAELKSGTRNWWFIMFTNVQIDLGFVVGAFVPMIVVGYYLLQSTLPELACNLLIISRSSQRQKTTYALLGGYA
jgi:MFS family permease